MRILLQALIDGGREVVGVYTQPDRASGRGHRLAPSAVKVTAQAAGLPVEQPVSLRSPEAESVFKSFRPDVFVVAAYGLIIPENILNIPLYGCINIHGSLLPRWRGAAPVQRAILEGDDYSGITVMQMDKGLDTGVMLSRRMCPITEKETAGSLFEKLTAIGIRAMKVLASHLDTEMTETAESAPGTILRSDAGGIAVKTADGTIVLDVLQLPGKKAMAAGDILNGHRDLFRPGRIIE